MALQRTEGHLAPKFPPISSVVPARTELIGLFFPGGESYPDAAIFHGIILRLIANLYDISRIASFFFFREKYMILKIELSRDQVIPFQ